MNATEAERADLKAHMAANERRYEEAARASARVAIADGHLPVTPDVADGTVLTSHVLAAFAGEGTYRRVVKRGADGELGLYRLGAEDYGIESTSMLGDRLDQFTINPFDQKGARP